MRRPPAIEAIDNEHAEREQTYEIRCHALAIIVDLCFDQGEEAEECHDVPGPEPGGTERTVD